MLYLRNTNQIQSLGGGVLRGPAGQPPPPTPVITGIGLFRTQYAGYFDGNPSWFVTATQSGSAEPNTGSINPGFTSAVNNRSAQWLGYFTPTTTENYTFYANADDAMFMWLGNAATASVLTTGSINIGAEVRGPHDLTGSATPLISGTLYPIRIQWGEADGAEYLSMSYETPTILKTTNWSPNMYYNTASNGF